MKPQAEFQQAPQNVAPPPLRLNKISKRSVAEIELIALALSQEVFANLVFENTMDLEPETSESSLALHFINSHIEMGNWKDCSKDLANSYPNVYELAIKQNKISSYHARSTEGDDFDELMQLINDCLNQISKASIEQKYEIIKEKLLSEQDPQIKQDLLKEYMALNQELKKN